jgi:hypothetical protein
MTAYFLVCFWFHSLPLQSGVLKPDEWKKKVEEFIQSEADAKA